MSSNTRRSHLVVPVSFTNADEHRKKLAAATNGILQGQTNNIIDVTLRASQTTTVITDHRCTFQSHYTFMPVTSSARTAMSGLYVSLRTDGSITLTHASNAATDQTFTMQVNG